MGWFPGRITTRTKKNILILSQTFCLPNLGQTALVKLKNCCFIIWLLLDEAEEHLGRGLSGVIARMALTMAVLLALPSYLLLMAKQRAAGVIKTTTNNPVLNCQYQIGGKRPYKNLQKLHKSGGIVVNLYEENLSAIAARDRCQKFSHFLRLSPAALLAAEITNGQMVVAHHLIYIFSCPDQLSRSRMIREEHEHFQCNMS